MKHFKTGRLDKDIIGLEVRLFDALHTLDVNVEDADQAYKNKKMYGMKKMNAKLQICWYVPVPAYRTFIGRHRAY